MDYHSSQFIHDAYVHNILLQYFITSFCYQIKVSFISGELGVSFQCFPFVDQVTLVFEWYLDHLSTDIDSLSENPWTNNGD